MIEEPNSREQWEAAIRRITQTLDRLYTAIEIDETLELDNELIELILSIEANLYNIKSMVVFIKEDA